MAPTVDVVMLSWNKLEFTRRAIESYRTCVKVPYRLICVDNGSTDGTVEYLRGEADLLVANSANVGAVRARNQGWAVSDADYILSTDNDVEFATDIVERLVAVAEAHPEVGIVGPLLNEHLGQAGLPTTLPLPLLTEAVRAANAGRIESAAYVPGCALFRRRLIEAVGGWDPAYDTWGYEEYDYCQRARAAGFRAVVAMDCYVHHHGNTSVDQLEQRAALCEKNQRVFLGRWSVPVGDTIGIVDPRPPAGTAGSGPGPADDDATLAGRIRTLRHAAPAPESPWPEGGVEALLGRLPDLGARILVVGAAPAAAVKALRHLYGREAVGLAPVVSAVRPYGVEPGEAHAVPAPDGHYDGVLALESLEHSPLPLLALQELRRVTRPGGLIVAVVSPRQAAWIARPGHFSVLDDEQWQALFAAARLEVLDRRLEDAAGDPRVRYVLRRPSGAAGARRG